MIGVLSTHLKNIDYDYLQEIGEVGIFTDAYVPPKNLDTLPVFSTVQSFDFSGTLVSTDMTTTVMLKKNSSTKKKVFYVSELEWMSMERVSYRELFSCFHDLSIQLITTPELYDVVSNLFREPAGAMKNIDKQLLNRIFPNE